MNEYLALDIGGYLCTHHPDAVIAQRLDCSDAVGWCDLCLDMAAWELGVMCLDQLCRLDTAL